MKFLTPLALAAALAGGAVAPAVPTFAKDKAPAGPKFTPAFIKAAKPAQDAVNAGDVATAEPLVAATEAAASNDDEKYLAAQFRLVLESKKYNAARTANPNAPADPAGLIKPLDTLIANPTTPQADKARYYFQRASFAIDGKQYPVAVDYFTKARDLGYTDPQLGLLLVRAKVEGGDVAGGMAELDRESQARAAKGEKVPQEWYKYAITQSNKRHLRQQTLDWMTKYVVAYPSAKTWYEVLATYSITQDSVVKLANDLPGKGQQIDVFRLMRATGGLADQYFYVEYAQKARDAGLLTESLGVLKEGLANGKIPATNTEVKASVAEVTRQAQLEGSLASQEAKAKAPTANAQLVASTGDVFLGGGNNAKAAELYRLALTKPGVDADAVNTHLGIALSRSGDKAGAQAAFAAVKGTPRAEIARFWLTYLDAPVAA